MAQYKWQKSQAVVFFVHGEQSTNSGNVVLELKRGGQGSSMEQQTGIV